MSGFKATTAAARRRIAELRCDADTTCRKRRRFAAACETGEALNVEHNYDPAQIASFVNRFIDGDLVGSADQLVPQGPSHGTAPSAAFSRIVTELVADGTISVDPDPWAFDAGDAIVPARAPHLDAIEKWCGPPLSPARPGFLLAGDAPAQGAVGRGI